MAKKASMAYQSGGSADPRQGAFVYTGLGSSGKTKNHEAHTSGTKFGMGDYYGRAMKQPQGNLRADTLGYKPVSRKQLGKPPKSLA